MSPAWGAVMLPSSDMIAGLQHNPTCHKKLRFDSWTAEIARNSIHFRECPSIKFELHGEPELRSKTFLPCTWRDFMESNALSCKGGF